MELPFSRLLKTCAKDLMDDTLWNAMGDFQHNGEEVRVSVKPVMDLHLLRFKSQSNSSDVLEDGFDVTSVPRPEVIYNDQILRKHGLRDPACAYHLEQLLAPGDVIIQRSYRQAFRQRWGKTVSKAAVLTGTAQPLETKSMEVVSRTRLLTWRDYPSSGQSTFAGVPFDPLTESFVTQVGSEMAWLVAMSPGSPGLINVNVGLFVSASFPSWATSLMTKMVHAMHELFQARMKEMKSIGCSEALLKEDRSLYIILSLRTCPQGRPLLPLLRAVSGREPEGVVSVTGVGAAQNLTTWFRPTGTFSLPSYLSDLLAILGCDDVQVFDSLEGRQLVPYQAVLRREQWERIGSLFNDVWLTHRAAYKKLNSCKHAPTIVDGRQPRVADKPFLLAPGYAEPVSPSYSIAVRNTFIEIGEEIPSSESPFSRACSR